MTYWQAPAILPTQCLSLPLHPMEIQVTKSVKALANSDNFTKQKLLKHLRRCPAQMGTSCQRGGASEEGGKTRWDWRHQEHPGENISSWWFQENYFEFKNIPGRISCWFSGRSLKSEEHPFKKTLSLSLTFWRERLSETFWFAFNFSFFLLLCSSAFYQGWQDQWCGSQCLYWVSAGGKNLDKMFFFQKKTKFESVMFPPF